MTTVELNSQIRLMRTTETTRMHGAVRSMMHHQPARLMFKNDEVDVR